jgi:pyrimidine deaminase RibD-like protein
MTAELRSDRQWLLAAIALSRRCPPSATAYSVGAIVVDGDGRELARGYSRDTDRYVHAEESALARLTERQPRLSEATMYTSMEPCSDRASRPLSCTQLILSAGIRRVVLALREPPMFTQCVGMELLNAAGVDVVEIPEQADQVRGINSEVGRTP